MANLRNLTDQRATVEQAHPHQLPVVVLIGVRGNLGLTYLDQQQHSPELLSGRAVGDLLEGNDQPVAMTASAQQRSALANHPLASLCRRLTVSQQQTRRSGSSVRISTVTSPRTP